MWDLVCGVRERADVCAIATRCATYLWGARSRFSVQEYLAHQKQPPPWDRHRVLGMVTL